MSNASKIEDAVWEVNGVVELHCKEPDPAFAAMALLKEHAAALAAAQPAGPSDESLCRCTGPVRHRQRQDGRECCTGCGCPLNAQPKAPSPSEFTTEGITHSHLLPATKAPSPSEERITVARAIEATEQHLAALRRLDAGQGVPLSQVMAEVRARVQARSPTPGEPLGIDLTGGIPSEDYVRMLRDETEHDWEAWCELACRYAKERDAIETELMAVKHAYDEKLRAALPAQFPASVPTPPNAEPKS